MAEVTLEKTIGNTVDHTYVDQPDETVEIPVEIEDGTGETDPEDPNPDEPDQPGGADAPTMTMPNNGNITYTIGGNDQPASADVLINAPKGIKSLKVWIESGNDGFKQTISDLVGNGLDFQAGVEVVGSDAMLGIVGEAVGVPNADGTTTEYRFPVGNFFSMMNIYGATAPNAHVFKIVLEDGDGNKVEDELSVTINPAN